MPPWILFVVPTIGLKLLYGFVIIRLDRRDVVWISVTTNSTADWIARQVTEAFPWNEAPLHDPGPGSHLWYRRHTPIARQGIRDKPTAPASPWQKGFAERLIGSIRRECLDHVIVLDEPHLRRILKNYAMRLVITASELIGLCTRMRRSLGLSSIVRDGANDVLVRRPRTK